MAAVSSDASPPPPSDEGPRPRRGRGGRPKKSPGVGQTVSLQSLVTEREAAAVRAEASAAGLSVSAYVRRRLLGRPVAPLVLAATVDAAQTGLGRVGTELNRVGVNLNQLARRANEGGGSGPSTEGDSGTEWAALAEEVRAAVADVRAASRALGRAAGADDGRVGPVYVRGGSAAGAGGQGAP